MRPIKPIFEDPSTWNFSHSQGRYDWTEFTEEELAYIECKPEYKVTHSLVKIGRNSFRIQSKDTHTQTCHRFVKAIFVTPNPDSDNPDAEIHEDRYGALQEIIQVSAMGEEHVLLKVKWYKQDAQLVDDITKCIYIFKHVAMEESFIHANAIDGQVCIVPVPFTARRLHRYNQKKFKNLKIRGNDPILDQPDSLLCVLDRCADFFGDLHDDELIV